MDIFEHGRIKEISWEEYKSLSRSEKRTYCLELRDYFAHSMACMHFDFTDNTEDKFAMALGTLFGSGECTIAGEVLCYPAIRLCFLIIDVMHSIDKKRYYDLCGYKPKQS